MEISGGRVQKFFREHGGKKFIKNLVDEFKHPTSIAYHLLKKYNFVCSPPAIRDCMIKHGIALAPSGGDNHPKRPTVESKAETTVKDKSVEESKPGRPKHEQVFRRVPGCSEKEWKKKVAQAQGKISRMKYDIEDM